MNERIYRYNEQFVDCNNITLIIDIKSVRRYKLTIPLKNSFKNNLLVIMMNPSKAKKEISDRSVNYLIKYFYLKKKFKIKKIIITNLYVCYESKSENLSQQILTNGYDYIEGIEQEGENNNDKIIKAEVDKADYIIFACGKPKRKIEKYDERIYKILKLLNENKVYHYNDLVKNKYPRHPSALPNNSILNKLNLNLMLEKFKK